VCLPSFPKLVAEFRRFHLELEALRQGDAIISEILGIDLHVCEDSSA
jgi:hypothetical protein